MDKMTRKKPLKVGEAVQVYKIWASTPSGPSYAWFGGYEFVSSNGKTTQVKHSQGVFKDCLVNYDSYNVRAIPSNNGK